MHSAQHYRQRAVQVRRLRDSVVDSALLKQLETVANEYDQIADDMRKLPATSRPAESPAARIERPPQRNGREPRG
jgi:hypothetical protein